MRSLFSRFAKPSRRRGVRRREVFSAQFDGGQSAALYGTGIHLGCDVLERRIVLTSSQSDFVVSQGTITGYTGAGGVVEIPSTIDGVPVAVIGQGAFQGNTTITSVVIPDSVKTIGDRAFRANFSLTTVTMGNHVTSIGEDAFAFAGLTAVRIPSTVTYIGDGAFYNNFSLTSVTIANAKTSIGDSAFSDEPKLATVSLGSGVTSIGNHAFDFNRALTAVTIPGTVTSIGDGAFSNNFSLKSVTIANAKTSIGNNAFSSDGELATVSLGNRVTSIGDNAFFHAGLTAVRIPSTVTSIGDGAFAGNDPLKSVIIANAKTSIGNGAFAGNFNLKSVTMGNHVTSIGISAFEGDTALKSMTFTAKAPTVGTDAFKNVPFGAKAIRAAGLKGYGQNGDLWNGLIVWTPGAVAAPTVAASTATLAQNAATMTITGGGFVAGKPSAHQVTFNNGAVGTVTAATATRLTVTLSIQPTSNGPLTAIVTSVGGTSGTAKQVATVKIAYQEVTVGNPNNANDTGGSQIGAVAYSYQIGTYDVTIGQYAAFLNSVAKSDPYSLYNPNMATDTNIAGIQQNGSSGSYTYSVIGSPNRPITYVSWFDAARFANWMTNGQGNGSTETGAYTLVAGQTSGTAPAANAVAKFRLPTQNEFYKAAYYSPTLNGGTGGYYAYATQSNTAPGNQIGSKANQANYNNSGLTDVGAFSGSGSFYGTFDQSGNVYQWNDLDGTAGSSRGLRGGLWFDGNPFFLSSSEGNSYDPSNEGSYFGFRLASPV